MGLSEMRGDFMWLQVLRHPTSTAPPHVAVHSPAEVIYHNDERAGHTISLGLLTSDNLNPNFLSHRVSLSHELLCIAY